jgi:hypothetical protein
MKIISSLIILLFSITALAQDCGPRDTDWRLRLGGALGYKMLDGWAFDASWETRIENDISQYEESLIDIAASYKYSNGIKIHGIFRHKFIPNDPEEYRVTIGASYGQVIGESNFEWTVRTRLQRDNLYSINVEEYTIRNKFSLVYELNKKLGFVIEDEIFYDLDNEVNWSRNRITSGIEWEFKTNLEFIAFYRFENDLGTKVADLVHTLGFYLEYTIKQKSESQKEPERYGHPYKW